MWSGNEKDRYQKISNDDFNMPKQSVKHSWVHFGLNS